MIISINAEKAFDKIQHSLIIRTLRNIEIKRNFLNLINVQLIFHHECLNVSPIKTGSKGRMSAFTTIIQLLGGAPREEKAVKDIEIGKETKFSLFVDDTLVYAKNPQEFTYVFSSSLS